MAAATDKNIHSELPIIDNINFSQLIIPGYP